MINFGILIYIFLSLFIHCYIVVLSCFTFERNDFMIIIRSEKGVTLIEVIASITILSIVLISIFNFFPQMGFMNKQNEDKIEGVNYTKQIMVKWKNSEEVRMLVPNNLENLSKTKESANDYIYYDEVLKFDDHYTFKTTRNDIKIDILIYRTDELNTKSGAYKIHVLAKNERGNILSESYGYIMSN